MVTIAQLAEVIHENITHRVAVELALLLIDAERAIIVEGLDSQNERLAVDVAVRHALSRLSQQQRE